MTEVVNPYIAGNPVTNAEMFFGRADVFAFVREALIGRHRDNVIILYGQRRTGKTSTLYQMHRQLGERYVCVLLDLHGLAMEGLDGFLWELANSIVRALRRDHRIELPAPSRASFQPDPRSFFENEFLNQVWRALDNRHLLLMLDEAIRLQEQVQAGKLDKQVFEYLRYLMQHYERLNFLFALGDGLESMTKEYAFLFSVGLYKKNLVPRTRRRHQADYAARARFVSGRTRCPRTHFADYGRASVLYPTRLSRTLSTLAAHAHVNHFGRRCGCGGG